MKLTSNIQIDDKVKSVAQAFDYDISTGEVKTETPDFEMPTEEFGIGLIVGGSGSGKTTILGKLGCLNAPAWDNSNAVISHFDTYEDGRDRLSAAGLNSIPNWIKPFHTLSNGEQFRANLARQIENGAVIDEFTSVVDRNVAKSCSVALSKHVKRKGLKGLILASCHYDIIEWLQPDWVFDVDIGEFVGKRPKAKHPN